MSSKSGRLLTTKVMKKNYNHNNRNCNSNNKGPVIEVTAGQRKVLNYAPYIFDKSLFKTVKFCYSLRNENIENIEPIYFKDIDFNLREGTESSMTLSFENEHKLWCEIEAKVMSSTTKEVLGPASFFLIETFNGTEEVSRYIIFADKISIMGDCTLVVNYSMSCIMGV